MEYLMRKTTIKDGEFPSKVSFIINSTASSISLTWKEQYPTEYISYEVKYREDGTEDFKYLITKQKSIEINELKSDTRYNVSIYGTDFAGDSSAIVREDIETDKSKFKDLKGNATLITSEKYVDLWKLEPAHVDGDEEGCLRSCYMIESKDSHTHQRSKEKTLLVLGATGAGKSTFIDALFNYVLGVSITDEFRYSIINKNSEEKERESYECKSQTRSVVEYKLPKMDGLRIDFPLNIIDSPGFNDTTQDFDKTIFNKIHMLFEHKINHLDAILIVMPASTSRLTEGQTHVFSCIRKMFGEDVKQNIFIVVSNYDGGEPRCLTLLKEVYIPCEYKFLFNNSNVFTKIKDLSREQTIWQERAESFANLFYCLGKVQKTTVLSSLKVLRARIMLELQLTAFEDTLSKQIQDVANYKKAKIIESKIKDNQDLFTLEIADTVFERKFTGKFSINCLKCLRTCHENCWVPGNSFIRFCEIMCSMKCTICNCRVENHCREEEIYKQKTVWTEVSEIEYLKTLPNLQKSFVDFIVTIITINNLIHELKAIAMFPDVLSTASYLDRIIQREKNEKNPEFEVRVKLLDRVVKHLNSKEAIRNLSYEYLTKDI